jgi:flagellar biosynthesis protein FliQ
MQITTSAILISVALAIFGISYYYFTTRNRERMAALEKGMSPDIFKDTTNYLPLILLLGIVSVGISLGILVGGFLKTLQVDETKDSMIPFSIFLFLGISLMVSYFVLRAMQKKSGD